MPTFASSSGLSRVLGIALPADGPGTQSARFGPSHPAVIPRTPPFTAVRRRVDNSLTCRDSSPESAEVRHKHVRNVEVGGSSPLTSTRYFPWWTACWELYPQRRIRVHPALIPRSIVHPAASRGQREHEVRRWLDSSRALAYRTREAATR